MICTGLNSPAMNCPSAPAVKRQNRDQKLSQFKTVQKRDKIIPFPFSDAQTKLDRFDYKGVIKIVCIYNGLA